MAPVDGTHDPARSDGDPSEDRLADDDADVIATARRRHGTAGAILAGGMLGLDKALGRPAKEEIPVVWEADGEPLDIDGRGITVPIDDEHDVHSHPGAAATAPRRPVRKRRR